MKKRILVFPCGSEIGLEIYRSMRYSTHFDLIGGSSTLDHGRFVYDKYVADLPFHDQSNFANRITETVHDYQIDAIYPTMDAVAETLQHLVGRIGCRVIGSDSCATAICASKSITYATLAGHVPVPACYATLDQIPCFPIFMKPDRGYGDRNSLLAENLSAARAFLASQQHQKMLLVEYLPGKEWTVDCFSDRHGTMRFHAARSRNRISNGISVNTSPCNDFSEEFESWSHAINDVLRPRGAWFYQMKEDAAGYPRLLEVAARLGGSSGLFRCKGVNFAMLSAFDAFDLDVDIAPNQYALELDRALCNRYKLDISYTHIFVDLDDCLLLRGRVNHQLIGFLHKAISEGKALTLLTRHYQEPEITLRENRIADLFDRVIHLQCAERKSSYIDRQDAIFIDDSFAERQDVADRTGIPVFSPDMIEALL